jgi:hypothetical protein
MLIPSQIILTYVRPSYWLPGLEIAWGVLTGLIAMTTNAKQVYALRVFLGLCESSAWPGMMTLFSMSFKFPSLARINQTPSVLVYPNRTRQANGILPLLPSSRPNALGRHASRNNRHSRRTQRASRMALAIRDQRDHHGNLGIRRIYHAPRSTEPT